MKKIESISELRRICQPEYEQVRYNPYYRYYRRFFRLFSIYLTRLLLKINTPANLISIFGILFGIIGSIYFYLSNFLVGSIILQLWLLMDTLDGEVARYYYSKHKQKNYLIKGELLDLNSHHLIHSLIFIGFSLGLYNLTKNINMIYLGIIALFSLLLNELIDLNKFKVLFYQNLRSDTNKIKKNKRLIKKLMFIYTFPSIVNIILIAALFNKVNVILYFYGITFPIIALIKFFINNFLRKW